MGSAGRAGCKVYGVTGRIGSGKSALCEALASRPGWIVLDADRIGHDLLAGDAGVRSQLRSRFGPGIFDANGEIDRGRLAEIVFADPCALRDLNAITHPRIVGILRDRVAALRQEEGVAIVLIDAALLLEWIDRLPLDGVVVVRCPDAIALERLRLRGMPGEEARRRMERQAPDEEFARRADHVIDNGGSRDDLIREANRLAMVLSREDEEVPG